MEKKVLVIGATGSVGRLICREVIRLIGVDALIVGDYQRERGVSFAAQLGAEVSVRTTNIQDRDGIRQALYGVSVVIVAVQQDEPLIQQECLHQQIPCLDIAIHLSHFEKVNALDTELHAQDTLSICMAGLFPGISGMMVKHLISTFSEVSMIDVALLQSTQGTSGETGIADMMGMLAQPVLYRRPNSAEQVSGFRVIRPIPFPTPFEMKKMRLVNYPEASLLIGKLGLPHVNYWTAFDKESFNQLLSLLQRVGILQQFNHPTRRLPLAKIIHGLKSRSKAKPETISVYVEVTGKKEDHSATNYLALVAPSDYGTTAMAVAAMTKLILEKNISVTGTRHPLEVFSLEQVLEVMSHEAITLHPG